MGLLAGRVPSVSLSALQQYALCHEFVDRLAPVRHLILRFVCGQWRFPGGAGQMKSQDVLVGWIYNGVLHIFFKEALRMIHEELIKGIPTGDHENDSLPIGATDSTRPLPGVDYGARVAYEDTDVQSADVDAQLQCRCRDDADQIARTESRFYLAAFFRQVPGPVRADALPEITPIKGCPPVDQLGDHARPGEDDGAEPLHDAKPQEVGRHRVGTFRRVEEEEMFLRTGSAAVDHRVELPI